jgi:hypothetical protein
MELQISFDRTDHCLTPFASSEPSTLYLSWDSEHVNFSMSELCCLKKKGSFFLEKEGDLEGPNHFPCEDQDVVFCRSKAQIFRDLVLCGLSIPGQGGRDTCLAVNC